MPLQDPVGQDGGCRLPSALHTPGVLRPLSAPPPPAPPRPPWHPLPCSCGNGCPGGGEGGLRRGCRQGGSVGAAPPPGVGSVCGQSGSGPWAAARAQHGPLPPAPRGPSCGSASPRPLRARSVGPVSGKDSADPAGPDTPALCSMGGGLPLLRKRKDCQEDPCPPLRSQTCAFPAVPSAHDASSCQNVLC